MERGWDAKGLLRPLWERLPGKRDELAELTGIRGTTLSSYNAGTRPLGIANARRIADALQVTVADLGGREGGLDAAPTIRDLLEQLQATVEDQQLMIDAQRSATRRLQARVRDLERRVASDERAA